MAETGTVKYVAVRQSLLEQIAHLSIGDQLPSEAALCDEFDVSRITLRHAVDGLVRDGQLRRERGRGTFVSEPQPGIHYPERFADAITGLHRQQTQAGNIVLSRVVRQELVPTPVEVREHLQLAADAPVINLTRLRYVNGQLHQYVITYLPHERFGEVLSQDFTSGSLYDYLYSRYGVVLTRHDLRVCVAEADLETALNLEVERGTRLLTLESTVFDADERAVAYGVATHTPEASEIDLSLRTPLSPSPRTRS